MADYENKPYVYLGVCESTGEFYIGYRESNLKEAIFDLGKCYKTNSKKVNKIGFENFKWTILKEFYDENRKDAGRQAWVAEQIMIRDRIKDPLCLNQYFINPEDNKGHFRRIGPHSEETKAKISAKQKDKKLSEETKMKMRKPKSKTSKLSEETKMKMRKPKSQEHVEKMRSRIVSDDTKQKISESHKNKKHTQETKDKLSKIKFGSVHTEEHKKKIGDAHRGMSRSEETKSKISEKAKERKTPMPNTSKRYRIISPDGIIYEGISVNKFCIEFGLYPNSIFEVCRGIRSDYKGWTGEYIND